MPNRLVMPRVRFAAKLSAKPVVPITLSIREPDRIGLHGTDGRSRLVDGRARFYLGNVRNRVNVLSLCCTHVLHCHSEARC